MSGGIEAIWIALGGNAAFLLVVAFLGKRAITHWLDKDLSSFKQQLQQSAQLEVERLRGTLQLAANEHSILLSHLQERRAEVIDQLYELLAAAVAAVTSYLAIFEFAGEPSKDEKSKMAYDALIAFRDYFDRRQIWLPPECCSKVKALLEALRKLYMDFGLERRNEMRGGPVAPEGWSKAWEAISEKLVPPARAALEAEMRKLLEPTRQQVIQPEPSPSP